MLSATLVALTLTAAPPTPEAAKSVIDFFYEGQGQAPVLVEAILCKDIEKKNKDTKFDCLSTFEGKVGKSDTVNVYLTFLVPKGDEKELMIQASHEGVVRATKDVKIKGQGLRTRTWRGFSASKPGTWEFKVLDGATVLKTLTIDAE